MLVSQHKARLPTVVSLCCFNLWRTLTPTAADLAAPEVSAALLRRRWLPMLACLNLCCRLLLIGAISFLLLVGCLFVALLSGSRLLA